MGMSENSRLKMVHKYICVDNFDYKAVLLSYSHGKVGFKDPGDHVES